ncbi:hypothetical protein KY285_005340 [Solanum tuberosum]|nr:hypothetical protein KY284_005561 [Solanum tuberosum]KAH0752192.1 hypothetical protein KY285_005340 [Solanum tuberosum]
MNVIQGIVPLDMIPGQGTMGTQKAGNTPVSEQKSRRSWDDKVEDYLEATIDASSKMTAQVNRGVFMVRFLESEERDAVVKEGVIMFDRKPIVIKQWKSDIEVMKEIEDKVPLWIKIQGLESNYWGKSALTKIASLVGQPLKADNATMQREKLMFARVLVEMSLNNTYPSELKEEIRNTEVNKEQQMGNQAPTNEFIKAKTVENKRVQFQQQRRNTTNTRNTFARLQQDPKVGNKKDDDEEEVNGTHGNMSLSMRNEVTAHVLYNQGKGETLSPMDKLDFWNVRGLNRADRQREVHLFMHTHIVGLFGLLETKFKREKAIKAA